MSDNPPLKPEIQSDPSKQNINVGCFLIGLFPFILVGSVFVTGSLEEGGNRVAGWLWIPFSVAVMLAFAHISYRLSERIRIAERLQEPDSHMEYPTDDSMALRTEGHDLPKSPQFEWETENSEQRPRSNSSVSYTGSILSYVGIQILVLSIIGAIAMLLAYFFSPFSGMGDNW